MTNKGLYGLCNHNDNLYIHKKIIIDEELGCQSLVEIDILQRLKHPHIINVEKMIINDKTIILLFPFVNKTLRDITNDKYLPTAKKLPILHKISSALAHLHQHDILYPDLKDTNIMMRDEEPLLIDFNEKRGKLLAPELLVGNNHSKETDVWAFGMLLLLVLINNNFVVEDKSYQLFYEEHSVEENLTYQTFIIEVIPNNLPVLLQSIGNNYCDNCINFLNKIFSNNRPIMDEIMNDKLFNGYTINKKVIENEEEKELNYAADTRDILKLLLHWIRTLYSHYDMKLLFLAVDLYNKAGCYFYERTAEERMYLAITAIWMSVKFIKQEDAKLDEIIAMIIDVIPTATKENIIKMEMEIIRIMEGKIADSVLYHVCTSVDQLAIAFEDIIMSRDSTLYCSTNIDEWIELVRATIPNGSSKNVLIKDFFG